MAPGGSPGAVAGNIDARCGVRIGINVQAHPLLAIPLPRALRRRVATPATIGVIKSMTLGVPLFAGMIHCVLERDLNNGRASRALTR